MRFIYVIPLLNLLNVPSANSFNEESGELSFVAVVFGHGDRAPDRPYPKDPYHSDGCWPNGWGQMTNLGKLQQFELGKWIRNRYCKFLPSDYDSRDIYVLSSDVDRTLVSAYSLLAGLYETWLRENKVKQLEWISIPVHTIPRHMDPLLASGKPCPLHEKLLREVNASEEVQVVNEFYQDIFQSLAENSGMNVRNIDDAVHLYHILNTEHLNGFQLPSWTKNYYPEPLKEITEFVFRLHTYTTQMKRLKCGPLLKDILEHMEDKANGVIRQKLWLYSTRDATLANLMQCLNVYDGILPPYTASLVFELYRRNSDWWVKLVYKTPTTIQVLRIPQCERFCSLTSFKKLTRAVVPNNWDEECQIHEE